MAHRIALLAFVLLGCFDQSWRDEPRPFSVGLTFSPDAALEGPALEAAARLTDATGVRFEVSAGGVPIQSAAALSENETRPDGTVAESEDCGRTSLTWATGNVLIDARIEIVVDSDTCWSDTSRTVEHEMIHALRAKRIGDVSAASGIPIQDMPDDHAKTGVFQVRSNPDWKLDEASLSKVCEVVDCAVFNVER